MPIGCAEANCKCAEKDKQILQFKSQIDRLQSKKLMLHATNLHLREQLDDCTRELEARLIFKEDEVQALRGTCKAMSSHVLVCQEKAVALQEELVKKDELLRVASSTSVSFNLSLAKVPSMDSPRSMGSPRSVHSISIQTSPRMEELERTLSYSSEDLSPLSARSEEAYFAEEVHELRYTVQVLKEQLEELHSAPASPSHSASPKRMPLASLADMVKFNANLRVQLPFDSSSCTSPVMSLSPMSRPPPTPMVNENNRSTGEHCLSTCTLDCQVLHALLVSELDAAEGIKRQAISLECEGALWEVQMMHDCFITQQRLLLSGLRELQQLEACQRGHLVQAEKNYRRVLREEKDDSLRQTVLAVRSHCPPVEHEALSAALEPHTLACEAMGRTAIILEEECSRQALKMYGDWHRAQNKLRLAAIVQMKMLEEAERGRIVQAEATSWSKLLPDDLELPQTPQLMSSVASSVGEDFSSRDDNSMEELWALREHSPTSSMDGYRTQPSLPKTSTRSNTAMQCLVSRQQRAWRLLLQQESNNWAHLIWLSDVELARCMHNVMLKTQISHGHLAMQVETEEAAARDALKQLFDVKLLESLRSTANRRCCQKVQEMWENERWTPMAGWGKTLLRRPPFSDATGKVALDLSVFDSHIVRDRLCWSSEGWELDISSSVDLDGWQYALAFNAPFRPAPGICTLVRRRKWVRACEPLPAAKPQDAAQASVSSTQLESRCIPVS